MTGPATVLGVTQTAPNFDVPPGACDCHVHVFGPPERFPFSRDRVYTPGPASVEDLVALHRTLNLDRVVIVQPSPYGTDNACLVDALRRVGVRARGVAVVDATVRDAALRELQEVGVRGIRVNLETVGERDPAVARTRLEQAVLQAIPLGWHVQVYTNLSVLATLHDSILALPVVLVIDHFGRAHAALGVAQPGFDALRSLLRRGKVYVKVSAPYYISERACYADAAEVARALIDANPDRVIWGTNWPHPGGQFGVPRRPDVIAPFRREDDGRALNRLSQWVSDPSRLRKILVDNPARLYGF